MVIDSGTVKKVLFEVVDEVYDFIKENYSRVSVNYEIPERESGEHPFVCWSESDLRTLIVHNLLQKIGEKVFVHTEIVLKKSNKFKYDGEFQRNLWVKTVDALLEFRKRKYRAGDIDIAVTSASSDTIPFLLIVEVKYYHYDVKRYGREVIEEIKEAYKMLNIMKDKGLTHDIALVIGDHYYHRHKLDKAKEIVLFSNEHKDNVIYLKI